MRLALSYLNASSYPDATYRVSTQCRRINVLINRIDYLWIDRHIALDIKYIEMMTDNLYRGRYRIDSARLTGYDYGSNGMYFVTICTRNREHSFGEVIIQDQEARVIPSPIGQKAIDCWLAIPTFHPYVELDAFQLMPNHIHAVLWICKPLHAQTDGQPNQFGPQRQNLASILRGYKSGVTTHATTNQLPFGWQPRFHDRIVRDQDELSRIRTYIEDNPANWQQAKNNSDNLYM